MMNYKLLTILMAAAALVGCSESDPTTPSDPSMPDGYEPSTTPITFRTEDNWGTTKGVVVDKFESGNTFSVLGYYLEGGTWDNDTAKPNFMHNQEVEYDGVNWWYSPMKYLPHDEIDRLRFFAFAPHSESIVPSSNSVAGYPELTYSPIVDPDTHMINGVDMVDFMTAEPQYTSKGKESVEFAFKHQLAQLRFSAKHTGTSTSAGDLGDKVKITGVQIDGVYPCKGVFTEDNGFVWSSPMSDRTPYKCVTDVSKGGLIDSYIVNGTENSEFEKDQDGYYKLTKSTGSIMLSPQTFKNTEDGKFEIGVEFELIKGHNENEPEGMPMNPAVTLEYDELKIESGMIYNLRFELSVTGYNYVVLKADIVREKWKEADGYDFGEVK